MAIDKTCISLYIKVGYFCTHLIFAIKVQLFHQGKYMKKLLLDNLLLERIRLAMTSLSKASGINLCMLDIMGNTIIYPTNDCALCKYVRSDERGRASCIRFAAHAVLEAAREKRTYYYKCPFGLIDFATAVFYEGEFIGAVCGGQVRSSAATEILNFVYPLAIFDDAGKNRDEIKKLYDAMPDLPPERIIESARFIELMTADLSQLNTFIAMHEISNNEQLETSRKLRPAITYIKEHYSSQITCKDMANLCCISENYFSRLFGRLTGTTLPQYITHLRIARAKELLEKGNVKVRAIAYEVGYDDPAYFNRKFKQVTGMTPTEWQKMIAKEAESLD